MIGLALSGLDNKDMLKGLISANVKKTFIGSENPDFDYLMQEFKKHGIECDNIHAPFDKINDMYSDNEDDALAIVNRLKSSIDKCAKYGIPIVVIHLSSGRPMPPITPLAEKRFKEVFDR